MTETQQGRPMFFATADDFRAWLEAHHAEASELMVGFFRKGSGRVSITWPEAVDQALCFGWIDGVRKSIDDTSYMNRFSPRTARSAWSEVNITRARELQEQGLMHLAGIAAFERRTEDRSGIYSYEQRDAATLDEAFEQEFRANARAWEFFQRQAPSYRKASIWWVVSAKKDETKRKRLATLIADSARERTVPSLMPSGQQS